MPYYQPTQPPKKTKSKAPIIAGIVIAVVAVIVIATLAIVFLKPAEEGREDKLVLSEYKKGDTWTARYTDEEGMTFIMTLTVSSTSFVYKGEDVIVLSAEYSNDELFTDEDGNEWDDLTGTGTVYVRLSDNKMIYMELEMFARVKFEGSEDWQDVRIEYKVSYSYAGNYPKEASIGDTFIVKATEKTQQTIWIDGDEVSNDTDTEIETRNYEVLGKKTVSVEAGQFECLEIRYEVVEENTYTLEYYSPKVKNNVKIIEYEGTNIVSMTELISYNVS